MYIKSKSEITKDNYSDLDVYYDCEMEILQGADFTETMSFVFVLLKVTQQTDFPLTVPCISRIKDSFFSLTRSKKFIGSQPVTISQDKIATKSNNLVYDDYAITLKLNGKRVLLYVVHSSIYEISSKMDVKYIDINVNTKKQYILDCELFCGKYYIFDILFSNDTDVRKLTFAKRQAHIDDFVKLYPNSRLTKKVYVTGSLYENTVKYYKKYYSVRNDKLDGLIYLPVNLNYNESIPLKWKPEYDNTIDFKIKKIKPLMWGLYCSSTEGIHIPFNVPEYNTGISLAHVTEAQDKSYSNGSIIEFSYSKLKETFVPVKLRHDKNKGNFISVAQDNFKNIISPFDFESLKHKINKPRDKTELFNARRFNNYVKSCIIKKYTKKAYTLLDLACGKGGDMHKYVDSNITYVKGYDNDIDSIEEAITRYNKTIKEDSTTKNYTFSFQTADLAKERLKTDLPGFVRNSSILKNETQFDIAVCFFAIHYFFKTERTLMTFLSNALYEIKTSGHFIFTTFCDKKLKELDYTIDTSVFKVKPMSITQGDSVYGKSVSVWIKDTVLDKEREEYVVDFDFLVKFLSDHSVDLVETGTFEDFYPEWKRKRNHLKDVEKKLSFLNRYAVFLKKKEVNIDYNFSDEPKSDRKVVHYTDFIQEAPVELTERYTLSELRAKKIGDLKSICRDSSLTVSGKKEELIHRILANEQAKA